MGEKIGNTTLTISHATGSTTSGGSFTVTSPPSINMKGEGNFVYRGTLLFSFLGGSSSIAEVAGVPGVITPGTVYGTGTIEPTATKVKNDSQFVIRENDEGSLTLFGTFVPAAAPSTPVPNTPIPSTDVKITDAGQIKVSAE